MGVWFVFGAAAVALVAMRVRDWFSRGPAITYPRAHRPRRAGGDAARDQPRGRRPARLGLRRARPLHDLPGAGPRGRRTGSPLPKPAEAAALARIGAPPGVRLACQMRPDRTR